jgi:hypothetical protein
VGLLGSLGGSDKAGYLDELGWFFFFDPIDSSPLPGVWFGCRG